MQQYISTITNSPEIKQLDEAVRRVFDSIYLNPLLANPTLITGLVFTSGTDLVISHKLNRTVKGYLMVGSTTAASLYTSPTVNSNPNQLIILRTNANTTANVLFF